MSEPPARRVLTLRNNTAWVGEGFPLGEMTSASWWRGSGGRPGWGSFALLMFYARAGQFPRGRAELDDEAVAFVARQVGVPASDLGSMNGLAARSSTTGRRFAVIWGSGSAAPRTAAAAAGLAGPPPPGPAPGEAAAEILAELGYDGEQIEALVANGTLVQPSRSVTSDDAVRTGPAPGSSLQSVP